MCYQEHWPPAPSTLEKNVTVVDIFLQSLLYKAHGGVPISISQGTLRLEIEVHSSIMSPPSIECCAAFPHPA